MNYVDSVKSGFKKYATFSGRASRSEFWYWYLFCLVFATVTLMLDSLVFHVSTTDQTAIHPIYTIFMLITMIPSFAVWVRRLHDVNRSGWWLLICFTVIGIFFPLFVWNCRKGTQSGNRFGPVSD